MRTPAAQRTNRPTPPPANSLLGPALTLLILATAYRVLLAWWTVRGGATLPGWMVNFTPVAALALCGGRLLPRGLGMAVPVGLLLVSDAIVDRLYGASFWNPVILAPLGCVAVLALVGRWLRRGAPGIGALLVATLGGSLLFYAVTNTVSWFGEPGYAQSFAGWVQALTTGLPAYPPTWVFFRNALASDLLVSMVLAAGCLRGVSGRERRTFVPAAESA